VQAALAAGATYADARLVHNRTETLRLRNGRVEALEDAQTLGLGLRALVEGGWGFASGRDLGAGSIRTLAGQSVEVARASARVSGEPVELGPPVESRGRYQTPIQVDPFTIEPAQKLELLRRADEVMKAREAVRLRLGNLVSIREHKWFANSEGASTEQVIYEVGGGIMAVAVGEGEVQQRSYPTSFGRQQVTAGWEAVVGWDLPGHAERVAAEAVALLSADPCPSGIHTVILGGDQVALQVHESCGHPIELDRVYGSEAAFAGTSFLTPDKLGVFRYGSEVVNLTAESLRPLGLGTFGWDDEGVPAQSTPIVRQGMFQGYLMSRETASRLGMTSNGCMRASGWNRVPLVRMTNVSLEPGEWSLADLLADSEGAIFMETNRSWSIDDRRYNFQFGTEIGYEVRGGALGRLLRNCSYTGITPEFWNRCDAVCDPDHWMMYGTPNCGKGQPGQQMHTGHGAAPARFRQVRVGVLG
jgi:TldD protein